MHISKRYTIIGLFVVLSIKQLLIERAYSSKYSPPVYTKNQHKNNIPPHQYPTMGHLTSKHINGAVRKHFYFDKPMTFWPIYEQPQSWLYSSTYQKMKKSISTNHANNPKSQITKLTLTPILGGTFSHKKMIIIQKNVSSHFVPQLLSPVEVITIFSPFKEPLKENIEDLNRSLQAINKRENLPPEPQDRFDHDPLENGLLDPTENYYEAIVRIFNDPTEIEFD